jgi:hypothetical protein
VCGACGELELGLGMARGKTGAIVTGRDWLACRKADAGKDAGKKGGKKGGK